MFEDGSIFNQLLVERLNYFIYVVLLLIGLWAMIAKNNLIKKLIGMSIFQTAIILFYVSIGVKEGATIPIYLSEHDPHGTHARDESNETENPVSGPQVLEASLVAKYTNPLPHVLMLTAIVVGVATLGLALSVCLRIYRAYGTAEEDELLEKLEKEDSRNAVLPKRQKSRRRFPVQKSRSVTQSKTVRSKEKSVPQKPKSNRRRKTSTNAQPKIPQSGSLNKEKKDDQKPTRAKRTRKASSRKSKEDNS